MSLILDVRIDARDVDIRLEVADGETVAILGPNGAGKSTLLAAISGLVRPDGGRASLDGTVLFEEAATGGTGRWLAPHRRGVSLLAQDAMLFPHLSVRDNVAFGPRSTGTGRAAALAAADRWLAEVDAAEFAARRPAELSGGQAQRVAVARALAAEPKLLLLDEPMAALDVSVTPAMRRMLRRVLADRSAVIVTHDALDAYMLADRVVLLEAGRVVDEGSPAEVFDRPRSAFAAGLAGVNLVTGVARGDVFVVAAGAGADPGANPDAANLDAADADELVLGTWPDLPQGIPLSLAVSPSAVSVSLGEPADPSLARFRAPILDLEPRGDTVRVRSAHLAADVSPREAALLETAPLRDPLPPTAPGEGPLREGPLREGSGAAAPWFSFPRSAATVYASERPTTTRQVRAAPADGRGAR